MKAFVQCTTGLTGRHAVESGPSQVQASYIARADSPQKLARTESQPMAYLQQLLGEKSHLPGLDIVTWALECP